MAYTPTDWVNGVTDVDEAHMDKLEAGVVAAHTTADAAAPALAAHVAAADPHTGYQRESEKGVANGYASLDSGILVPDAQIPPGIARDSEVSAAIATEVTNRDAAIAAHAAAADPHTTYQKEGEKAAANGYASLDSGGKVPSAQLPAVSATIPARITTQQNVSDWNAITESGWYAGSDAANGPLTGWGWWLAEVFVFDGNHQFQRIRAVQQQNNQFEFQRAKIAGVWQGWHRAQMAGQVDGNNTVTAGWGFTMETLTYGHSRIWFAHPYPTRPTVVLTVLEAGFFMSVADLQANYVNVATNDGVWHAFMFAVIPT